MVSFLNIKKKIDNSNNNTDMMNDNFVENRKNTLKFIGDDLKMPSEIARGININTSQVSSALSDLKNQNLVICINEEVRKGRLYKCTELGLQLIELLD